ncbi:MAG: hypothetical protein AAFU85_21930 [Planctomycetota bacterium]
MKQFVRSCLLRSLIAFLWVGAFVAFVASAAEPPVTAMAFAHDGESLVAVSQSGIQVRAWPGLEVLREVEVTTPNLHCCRFSPQGTRLAIGGGYPAEEGVVKVYSWPELKLLSTDARHADSVVAISWRDERHLITSSLDRMINQLAIESDASNAPTLSGHSRGVTALCVLSDGDTLVSGGEDQSLRVWSLNERKVIRSLNQHTSPIGAVALRPSTEGLPVVASAAADRTIRFWQPTIGRMVRYARLPAEPLAIAWLDDRRIAAACHDGRLRVIDSVEVSITNEIEALDGWAYALAVHPSDGTLAIGGAGGVIRRIDAIR